MSVAHKMDPNGGAQNDIQSLKEEIKALNRVQAVIEFNLDGTILHANENFLKGLGYSLNEIVNHHHAMFCDPVYAQSNEYKEFWKTLARGEFVAGEFKRVAKGGREIWINASYNPIFDATGNPYKVVKFATDVTEAKLKTSEYEGKVNAISRSQAVIEFNLDGTIIHANENFLNGLGYALNEIQTRHHSMFCDPAYTQSAEYKEFWKKLAAGEFIAGEFKRFGKGAKKSGLMPLTIRSLMRMGSHLKS